MAKVITDSEGVTHLRHADEGALCDIKVTGKESEGDLTCPHCAKIALHAMELVTRAEKREWRKL